MDAIVARAALTSMAEYGMTLESITESWDDAIGQYGSTGRTKDLLKTYKAVGCWIVPELHARVVELGKHRVALFHCTPYRLSGIRAMGDTTWAGTVTPSVSVDPAVRRRYAEHGIKTMLDLWFASQIKFAPGEYPGDDWKPATPGTASTTS